MWLTNAKHLRRSANHVSISPDVPPVSKKTCSAKRPAVWGIEEVLHQVPPTMALHGPRCRQQQICQIRCQERCYCSKCPGCKPMFSIQEPDAWFIIVSMKQSSPFSLPDYMWRKTSRITASFLNPIVLENTILIPSIHLQCFVTLQTLIVMLWLFVILLAHKHVLIIILIKILNKYYCSKFIAISFYLIVN